MAVGIDHQRIGELARLEENWDSYGGKPPTDKAMKVATGLNAVPTSEGGIQLEWHVNGWDIELAFDANGEPIGYFQEKRKNAN